VGSETCKSRLVGAPVRTKLPAWSTYVQNGDQGRPESHETPLARGLGLERQLDPDPALEEIYTEYAWAMTQAFTERSTT